MNIHSRPEPRPIAGFQGEYRWLSNFWPAEVMFGGRRRPTVEHAYQAAKTVISERDQIAAAETPGAAKRLGRDLTVRDDWGTVRAEIMRGLVRDKFERHPKLAAQLRATAGRELIEANTWGDRFWGASDGAGENWLGRIPMDVRSDAVRPAGPWGQRRSMLLGLVFGGGLRGWVLRAMVVLVALLIAAASREFCGCEPPCVKTHSCAPRMIPGAALLRNRFAPTSPPASRTL